MRILMLTWEYPPRIVGGISRVVHGLAQNLGAQGNEVHVLTLWEPGTEEVERDGNVFVHRVHNNEYETDDFIKWVLHLNISLIQYGIKLINEFDKFDIIHAHDWMVTFAANTLKHSYTIPLVSTIHATEYGRNSGIRNEIQNYINNIEWSLTYESWKVIVNSFYMKNEVQQVFHMEDNKIRVIPNGVNEDKFKGVEKDWDFRRSFALDNEKVIFNVGRIVNEKGTHLLIEALPKILNNYYDVKLVIAGKGPQMDKLRQMVWERNITHKVYFTGYINDNDLLKLYKCSDIAVFPSLYEPFGIVALEGMVANIPVVVSDTGGLGEIIEHGNDGMKFYNGNANSLADCVLDLLYNQGKVEYIKANALKKVHDIYNWNVISKKTQDVYKEIINENKNSGWKLASIKKQLGQK